MGGGAPSEGPVCAVARAVTHWQPPHPARQSLPAAPPARHAARPCSYFSRKHNLVHPARALVATPGGFGTADELFEVLTLIQSGKVEHPETLPVVLFGAAYWCVRAARTARGGGGRGARRRCSTHPAAWWRHRVRARAHSRHGRGVRARSHGQLGHPPPPPVCACPHGRRDVINWERFLEYGVISQQDLDRLYFTDSVEDAFDYVTGKLLEWEAASAAQAARAADVAKTTAVSAAAAAHDAALKAAAEAHSNAATRSLVVPKREGAPELLPPIKPPAADAVDEVKRPLALSPGV